MLMDGLPCGRNRRAFFARLSNASMKLSSPHGRPFSIFLRNRLIACLLSGRASQSDHSPSETALSVFLGKPQALHVAF